MYRLANRYASTLPNIPRISLQSTLEPLVRQSTQQSHANVRIARKSNTCSSRSRLRRRPAGRLLGGEYRGLSRSAAGAAVRRRAEQPDLSSDGRRGAHVRAAQEAAGQTPAV